MLRPFVVLKPFDWNEQHYEAGDRIEIEAGHPRLEAMVRWRFLEADMRAAESAPTPQLRPRRPRAAASA